MSTFLGYPRAGRGPGVRNLLLVLPTSESMNFVVDALQTEVPDAVAITMFNPSPGGPKQFHVDVLVAFASNPNIGRVVLAALGDDEDIGPALRERLSALGVGCELHTLLDAGSTDVFAERMIAIARDSVADLASVPREPVPLSELIVATECGGSDAYSGLTANPALGAAMDLLVADGGTAILSELTEIIGAEHVLASRAASKAVGDELVRAVRSWEDMIIDFGEDLRGAQPTPGNQAGGLTTIEEKSLGAIYKGGTTPLVEVIGYAKAPTKHGLVVMDTPGHDIEQLTGMAAGGAQIVVFTTGRGTPTSSPIAPTIKVATNHACAERIGDHIDIDAGFIADGSATKAEIGRVIYDRILAVAQGETTKAEHFGQRDFALPRTISSVQ